MLSNCDNPHCEFHEVPVRVTERKLIGGGTANYCEACCRDLDNIVDDLYAEFMNRLM